MKQVCGFVLCPGVCWRGGGVFEKRPPPPPRPPANTLLIDEIFDFFLCLRRIQSPDFILDLGLMIDVLSELSILSEYLQNRDITVPPADRAMSRTVRLISKMERTPGPKSEAAIDAARKMRFGNLVPQSSERIIRIDRSKFLAAFVKSLSERHFATVAIKGGPTADSREAYNLLVDDLKVLSPACWPSQRNDGYGEAALGRLCERFSCRKRAY